MKNHFKVDCIYGHHKSSRFLSGFLLKMLSLLVSIYTFMIRIIGFISKYVYRSNSNFGANFVSESSEVRLSSGFIEKNSLNLRENRNFDENIAEIEYSVFSKSKYQFVFGENISGYVEDAERIKLVVHEMFVGSNDVFVSDQRCDFDISGKTEFLKHEVEENTQEFDEKSEISDGKDLLELEFGEKIQEFDGNTEFFLEKDLLEHKFDEDIREFDEKSVISVGKDVLELEFGENIQEFDGKSEFFLEKDSLEQEFEENTEELDEDFDISQGKDILEMEFEEPIQKIHEKSELFEHEVEENTHDFDEKSEFSRGKDISKQDFEENSQEFHEQSEISQEKGQKLEENVQESDEKSVFTSFSFNLFNPDNLFKSFHEEKENIFSKISEKEIVFAKNEIMDDQVFSYEVQFLPQAAETRNIENSYFDDDDDYIELKPEIIRKNTNISRDFYSNSDSDEDDDKDVLLEHQYLVQQMKMELKSCRVKGLPTILEECENPKMFEDLKPLKIDQKLEYKDLIEEIQKFYKCYFEKMRKLDVLNYQTLHAISFLQLKDSEVFNACKKKSASTNFVLPKTWPWKVQRVYADPMHKSIVEMHRDLELVYVGQLCLSWEILVWLYIKARELLDYDCTGTHSYNRVAEEFQQFQVLVQRFMEDEPFQGHRVQNYVKTRCLIRSLLHVPMIKDDCFKGTKGRREETDAITLEMLIEIIRESMLVFREFLWSDKRSKNMMTNGISGTKVDNLQDPTNLELFLKIVTDLQKKERRIRENTRSEKCIVKKLKKHRECRLDHRLFTCEVELRLVSRVLSMSRLTKDQLLWCQTKLSNINFVRGKVHLEQSFLLIPC